MQFRSIGLSLRFIVPLALVLTLFGYLVMLMMDKFTLRWFIRDLDMRSQLLTRALEDPLAEYLPQKSTARINALFDRAILDERLYAVGFCDPAGVLRYKTSTYPVSLGCWHPLVGDPDKQSLVRLPQGPVHVAESELKQDGVALGRLILVHDMSFIERRSADTKKYILGFFALLALAISFITVVIAHLSWRGWVNGVREMLRGELTPRKRGSQPPPEVQPLASDLRKLLRDYHLERQNDAGSGRKWTGETLKALLQTDLAGDQVLVVSNREPYIHEKTPQGSKSNARRAAW